MEKKEKTLTNLPDTIEEIEKDPILKPILDYQKAAYLLEEEDKSEGEYKEQKVSALKELLETGNYQNSLIAKRYDDVLEIYKRLLFIYTRYIKMSNAKMLEVKETNDKYYISMKKHQETIKQIDVNPNKEKIDELNERIKELKEKLKEGKKPPKEKTKEEEEREEKRKKYAT